MDSYQTESEIKNCKKVVPISYLQENFSWDESSGGYFCIARYIYLRRKCAAWGRDSTSTSELANEQYQQQKEEDLEEEEYNLEVNSFVVNYFKEQM
jgi:hypothetical protein